VAQDRRKRKRSGTRYGAARSKANYKRRTYIPSLARGGGGSYGGPKNYYRHHDFKYEKEPELKPPKVETHYAIERPIESYRLPPYRPEFDQTSVEKIIGQTIERYHHNDLELEELEDNDQTQRHTETENPLNLQRMNVEANSSEEKGLGTSPEIASEAHPDMLAQPESLLEFSQEANATSPEPFESYELPIADLELLLIELDANPLEVQPENRVEAEGAEQ